MSRVGKKPVAVPSGVQANVEGQTVKVKGPKGALQAVLPDEVTAKVDAGAVKVDIRTDTIRSRAMWGLSRSLVANLMTGVTKGFEKRLAIEGVGYQARMDKKSIVLTVGFANPITLTPPDGVAVALTDPTHIVVTGADKQKVGQFAAEIRAARPPEPYKGKGVRYENEQVRRKEGKSFASGG